MAAMQGLRASYFLRVEINSLQAAETVQYDYGMSTQENAATSYSDTVIGLDAFHIRLRETGSLLAAMIEQ
jgi:hypothetical protein